MDRASNRLQPQVSQKDKLPVKLCKRTSAWPEKNKGDILERGFCATETLSPACALNFIDGWANAGFNACPPLAALTCVSTIPQFILQNYFRTLAECFRLSVLYAHCFFVTLFLFKRVNAGSCQLAQSAGFAASFR